MACGVVGIRGCGSRRRRALPRGTCSLCIIYDVCDGDGIRNITGYSGHRRRRDLCGLGIGRWKGGKGLRIKNVGSGIGGNGWTFGFPGVVHVFHVRSGLWGQQEACRKLGDRGGERAIGFGVRPALEYIWTGLTVDMVVMRLMDGPDGCILRRWFTVISDHVLRLLNTGITLLTCL